MATASELKINKNGQYVITIGIKPTISKHLITPLTSTGNIEYLGYEPDEFDDDSRFYFYSIKVSDYYTAYIEIIPNLNWVIKLGGKFYNNKLKKD